MTKLEKLAAAAAAWNADLVPAASADQVAELAEMLDATNHAVQADWVEFGLSARRADDAIAEYRAELARPKNSATPRRRPGMCPVCHEPASVRGYCEEHAHRA